MEFGYRKYNENRIVKTKKKRICAYFVISDLHKFNEADIRYRTEELLEEIKHHKDWMLESVIWEANHRRSTDRKGLNTILEKAKNNEFDILLLHHVSLISLQCGLLFDYVLQLHLLNKTIYGIVDNIHSFDDLANSIPLSVARKKIYENLKTQKEKPKSNAESQVEARSQKVPKITIGYTVGKLTVKERLPEKKNGFSYWQCECECGGEIALDTRYLQRGTVRDCGCETRVKPGQKDLTDVRFGNLVCRKPTDIRGSSGGVVWECDCDCGNTCLAVSTQLTQGYKKSCGCLSHPPLKEFVGKHFGDLEVIEYAGKWGGLHHWKCKCKCGNETITTQGNLQTGHTTSCGCKQEKQILENLKLCDGTSVAILEASKRKLLKSNKSGYTGVYQAPDGLWRAQITFKGKTYHLGSFTDKMDAVRARKRGEEMHDEFLEWYYKNQEENKEK